MARITLVMIMIINAAATAIYFCSNSADGMNPGDQWSSIRRGLETNKEQTCESMMQRARDIERGELTLQGVSSLFEEALDHVTGAYVDMQKIKSFIDEETFDDFHSKAGTTILAISANRHSVQQEYNAAKANGASHEELDKILQQHFYKACAAASATAISEQSINELVNKTAWIPSSLSSSTGASTVNQQPIAVP